MEKSGLDRKQLITLASALSFQESTLTVEQTLSSPTVPIASDHLRGLVESAHGMINGGEGDGDGISLANSKALESALEVLQRDGLLEQASSVGATSSLPPGLLSIMSSLLSDKPSSTSDESERPLLDRSHRRKFITHLSERLSLEVLSRCLVQILPNLRFNDGKDSGEFLLDLGFNGTQTLETFKAIWSRFDIKKGKEGELQISRCLAKLLEASVGSSDSTDQEQKGSRTIDLASFVKSVNESLKSEEGDDGVWSRVIKGLDEIANLDISLPVGSHLESLATVLNSNPSAVSALLGEWSNPALQLNLISGLLTLPNEVFSFCSETFYPAGSSSTPTTSRIVSPEDAENSSATIKTLAQGVFNLNWNRRELIETLSREAGRSTNPSTEDQVSSKDPKQLATSFLEKAIKESPECVAIGLVLVKQPWNSVHSSLASKLLSMFLAGHPSHQLVFLRLNQIDQEYLLKGFRNLYEENEGNVSRILDVSQDLKILDRVLDLEISEEDLNGKSKEEKLKEWNKKTIFSFDIAALASRREYLNLDKWLQDNINHFQKISSSSSNGNGNLLIQKTLDFLDLKTKEDLKVQQRFLHDANNSSSSNNLPLMVQTVAIFLRVLRSNGDFMNSEEIELFKIVRNLCLQLHPRLMNLAPGKENTEPGLQVVTFTAEIHKEVSCSP